MKWITLDSALRRLCCLFIIGAAVQLFSHCQHGLQNNLSSHFKRTVSLDALFISPPRERRKGYKYRRARVQKALEWGKNYTHSLSARTLRMGEGAKERAVNLWNNAECSLTMMMEWRFADEKKHIAHRRTAYTQCSASNDSIISALLFSLFYFTFFDVNNNFKKLSIRWYNKKTQCKNLTRISQACLFEIIVNFYLIKIATF